MMFMKLITTIVTAFAVLFLAGCSKSGNPSAATPSVVYPTDAATVTPESGYMLMFTSSRTSISYYVRRLANEDVSKMPEASVIKGEGASVVFVPIKDGKIVDADPTDRAELGTKIPPGMLR